MKRPDCFKDSKETILMKIKDVEGALLFRHWKGDEAPPEDKVEKGDYWETETADSAYKFDGEEWLMLRGEPFKKG